jgi:hypothetical protein
LRRSFALAWLAAGFALALSLGPAGCGSVRFLSEYDEVLDLGTTDLQRRVETFLLDMEAKAGTPAGEFGAHRAFYDAVRVDLIVLRTRAQAVPKNALTVEQFDLLGSSLEKLRELHERGGANGLPREVVEPSRTALGAQFVSILKLELAKKRGDEAATR